MSHHLRRDGGNERRQISLNTSWPAHFSTRQFLSRQWNGPIRLPWATSDRVDGVVRDVAAFRVVALADLITHQFDGHPFAGRHGIEEVAELEARYHEQAAVT